MEDIKLRNGLHAGITIVIICSILHAIDPRMFLNYSGFAGYMVFLFFMTRSVRQTREEEGGTLPFGSAFVAALVPMTIGVFFSSFFNYAIHNWINPGIVDMIKEVAIESAMIAADKMSSLFDIEVDEDQLIAALEEEGFKLNFGKTFLSWFLTTAMGCIPALIIAAFMKRN